MSEKKKLVLNCDICDCRRIKKELYDQYEEIQVNADILFVNDQSKEVMNRLPMNCTFDCMAELNNEERIAMQSCNGKMEISGDTVFEENTVLNVNGMVNILPGAGEVLKKLRKIIVNGKVCCPKSLAPCLAKAMINGTCEVYPDDCIVLKSEFAVDKYFPMRAKKDAKYYVGRKVILVDDTADVSMLVEKNVRFITPKALIAEKLVADACQLFDEHTEFQVIPDGFALLQGDIMWNHALLSQYGKKLYVNGSLRIEQESVQGLEELEELIVAKELCIPEKYEDFVLKLNVKYQKLKRILGKTLERKRNIRIDRAMLGNCPDGLLVSKCVEVKIEEEIEPAEIMERLKIENCASVLCAPGQRNAVELISSNVAVISDGTEEKKERKLWENAQVINADYYVL